LTREAEDRRRANKLVTIELSQAAQKAEMLGDPIALRRLFANLIDNAIAYGHEARITADVREDVLAVTIDDSGPGIREEDRAAMMEPFVRREASRNRRTGGAGLGLAVARAVAESHGGTLTLADAPDGGLRAVVNLPVFKIDRP
ncbi:MAG: ATP-binding protein, partial [Rhodoplanes sp.]